jgi:hypothetical protein
MGMNGAIGLDVKAIELIMDYYDVDKTERLNFSTDVRNFANKVLKIQYDYQNKNKK